MVPFDRTGQRDVVKIQNRRVFEDHRSRNQGVSDQESISASQGWRTRWTIWLLTGCLKGASSFGACNMALQVQSKMLQQLVGCIRPIERTQTRIVETEVSRLTVKETSGKTKSQPSFRIRGAEHKAPKAEEVCENSGYVGVRATPKRKFNRNHP
jgi:hypothetical protein